jgi:hypothetical protein
MVAQAMKVQILIGCMVLPLAAQARTSWDFTVLLDGKPVGWHRYSVQLDGDERVLTSTAHLEVRILGLTVYRYTHDATERWKGDCLLRLSSRTDDNGERLEVERWLDECAMSFAYWNVAMLKRSELLNPQTGRFESVAITPLGEGRHRITGTKNPIELQYSPSGEWIALDSTVSGGRTLSYRLQ